MNIDKIVDKNLKLFKRLLKKNLKEVQNIKDNCKHENVSYIGEDYTGKVWISVYECKDCGKELI